jgi:superfamily I DNA and/or RNA helicase
LYTREVIDEVAASLACSDRVLLTRSDFERAFESSYGNDVGAMLQVQYRMAPPIGDLVSSCFYPTPLLPGRGDPPEWFSLLPECAKSVVTWIDTSAAGSASREQKKRGETSYSNRFEGLQVMDVLRQVFSRTEFMNRLYDDCDEDAQPIGVICGYADQKYLLQRTLSEQPWAAAHRDLVKIDTVDSYQGKENRMIILSLTRNNDRFEQGFLASPERANVSISRAMDRLIIVGAARMWRDRNQQSPFGKILSYIEQHSDSSNFRLIQTQALRAEGVAQHG